MHEESNKEQVSSTESDTHLMRLQIFLPSKVFDVYDMVESIVLETPNGAFGLLPLRQDCVAALEPGILTYTIQGQRPQYLAVDEGIMVKNGHQVRVSVRNAHKGANLAELKASVQKEFLSLSEEEREVRAVLARLESGFLRGFKSLHTL